MVSDIKKLQYLKILYSSGRFIIYPKIDRLRDISFKYRSILLKDALTLETYFGERKAKDSKYY